VQVASIAGLISKYLIFCEHLQILVKIDLLAPFYLVQGGDNWGITVRKGFDRQHSHPQCLKSDTEPTRGSSVTRLSVQTSVLKMCRTKRGPLVQSTALRDTWLTKPSWKVDVRVELWVVRDVVNKIWHRRLSNFGHVVRIAPSRTPNILLHGRVEGTRPRGTPNKRWLDVVREDCNIHFHSV